MDALARPAPFFDVVLVEPEIPNNTGNIGRTCVAAGCSLHLVHPLGFDTSEKACRRAGLDYWARLGVREHPSWAAYEAETRGKRRWFFSTKGARAYFDATFEIGDALIFGRETAGLSPDVLAANSDRVLFMPMMPGERSLNVATAVCAVVYEGVRQLRARGAIGLDDAGRIFPGNSKSENVF